MKTLRPYQAAALKATWEWIFTKETMPLVVAPVGSGKSLMIAEFIKQCHERYPGTRILMLTHDKRLLEQNMEELREQYPTVDAGFYCAGLNQKRLHNDVTFASIQSIHAKAAILNRAPGVILIDEAHLVNPKAATRYRSFIEDCFALNPMCRVIGFTGSPFRSDSGLLYTGSPRLFDGVAYEIPISYMIEQGYLCRPILPKVETTMNVDGVGMKGGDYIEKQLDDAINTDEITRACVEEIIEKGVDRHAGLIFTVTTDHCDNVVEEFKRQGETSVAGIHSKMDKNEVARTIELFKAGKIKYLVNVAMLTTGFNHPAIDLLAYMRPTRSPVLYIQCTGRGLRTLYAPGYDLSTQEGRLQAIAASQKKDCMILDFGGVVSSLGPIDDVDISGIKDRNASESAPPPDEPEIKFCPNCEAPASQRQRHCYECGHEFYEGSDPAISNTPETKAAILSQDIEPETLAVWKMRLSKHRKRVPDGEPPATPVMKVTYETAAGLINEWVCFEHVDFARQQAEKWHAQHLPCYPVCFFDSIDKALEWQDPEFANAANRYVKPHKIMAKKSGKYWTVVDKEMPTKEEILQMVKDEESGAEVEATIDVEGLKREKERQAGWMDELIDF